MPKRALFPISIDSDLFTTSFVAAALEPICRDHDEILFLIADHLHVYNKTSAVREAFELENLFSEFPLTCAQYIDERCKWLDRIRIKLGKRATLLKWQVFGMSRFLDAECYSIYRRVLLAFHTLEAFRTDVSCVAKRHVDQNRNIAGREVRQRLSEAYVIEEIALNLRVRILEKVTDEYYLGKYPEPLLGVYSGKYNLAASSLAGVPIVNQSFNFFAPIQSSAKVRWKPVLQVNHSAASLRAIPPRSSRKLGV